MNPLQGWDIASVQKSGIYHGLNTSDILGCLFFHVKSELARFARRFQNLRINIYFTQYDVRVLSTGICSGLLPAFGPRCFDRIDAGELMDTLGVRECLLSLAPLVNPQSPGACLLMHSRTWYHRMPCAIARDNPRLLQILMTKAKDLPALVNSSLLYHWMPILIHFLEVPVEESRRYGIGCKRQKHHHFNFITAYDRLSRCFCRPWGIIPGIYERGTFIFSVRKSGIRDASS